ncbi:hypothetical protein [Dysgonomonas sp. 511]|uniref:hypothetical protein n=1 Tax=Dysgonomonas sp. 511 TaxID=2302930 RepID=UPI0013D74208|nr:hypothetical protein [Dysgonomonas sp. 511]NDV79334.1 hypothetical protein [Dysgonomonas sp. 511]
MSSPDKNKSKRFLLVFTISAITMLFLIGLTTYLVDPFLQFRVNPNKRYLLNAWFVNGGLAKNYDFNTVVLGSSMIQNCDLNVIRNKYPGAKPLRLSIGGIKLLEMEHLYSLIDKQKVDRFIICLDLPPLNDREDAIRYPRYLYDDGLLNKLQYLYSYESVVRFLPVDVGVDLYLKNKTHIPDDYEQKTNIDNIGNNFKESFYYNAEQTKTIFSAGITVTPQYLDSMDTFMPARLDSMLSRIAPDKYPDIDYIFILPPYSALYWITAQNRNYYDYFMHFPQYIATRMAMYKNVRLMYFFDIPQVADLENYRDVTHFSPAMTDWMMDNIDNDDYLANSRNIDDKIARTDSIVKAFIKENDWIPDFMK